MARPAAPRPGSARTGPWFKPTSTAPWTCSTPRTSSRGGRFDTGQAGTWSDGDFGYDGLVDILDAADFIATTLFDEGAYVPITAGSVTAVPEPALPFAGLAAILVSPLLRRIGRRLRPAG